MSESQATEPQPPLLRVVSANATPEEIAALVAVLSTLGGASPAEPRRRPEWNAPRRLVQPSTTPRSWRASALPR